MLANLFVGKVLVKKSLESFLGFFLEKGGRKVAHATVFRFRGKEYIDLPTIILKIEQKNN